MQQESILIVEDDGDIQELIRFTLESAGFTVHTANEGFQALNQVKRSKPDLVLLDVMLPGMDGFDICKELKRNPETAEVPVLMLTARGEEVDRIVGLELGADDYVVKPFSPRELVLRVKAMLRRVRPEPKARSLWRKDGLTLDLDAHKAMVNDEEIALTATEFKLLSELIKRKGRVQTRDQLLNTVWGYEFEGYARTVDTHVRRLRQKLGPYAALIETVRGVGYRFQE